MQLLRISLLMMLLAVGGHTARAQLLGMFLANDGKQGVVTMPFESVSNLIVLPVHFNGVLPLKFVLDTGAKNTILIHKEFAQLLGLAYEREITLYGADLSTPIPAYLVRNIDLELPGLNAQRQSILVLENDVFSFEKSTGVPISGILGIDFFRRFIVKIDYANKRISFYEKAAFDEPLHKYEKVPIEVVNGRMYLNTPIRLTPETTLETRLLLDTGAATSLIVNTNRKDSLILPKSAVKGNIARGLGGNVMGYTGRVEHFALGHYDFENVVTHFQQLDDSLAMRVVNAGQWREGIVGGEVLARFHIVFDYNGAVLYLRPNRNFKKKIRYDKSGIFLISTGLGLDTYEVDYVQPNSPAYEAGVRLGDVLRKVNGMSVTFSSLAGITGKLQGKSGKRIKLEVLRQGQRLRFSFVLRDLF
jgi:predicted aspartyl protease